MRNSKTKAVIFDIGGVLELSKQPERLVNDKHLKSLPRNCKHRHKGVHEYITKKLNISIDQWFDSIDTTYADSITGKIPKNRVLSTISKNTQTSKDKIKKIILDSYKKNFKTNKELYNFAFKLKKKGYKIAILSDQWHLSKEALIKPKYLKKFNVSVISCDVGMRKPNPKIYKLILKKLNVPAKNCLFIDNQQWNIIPAKKLGMKTILFKNNKQLFRQLEKELR